MSETGTNTPERPQAVTVATRVLWTVAAVLVAAAAVKVIGLGPAGEAITDAQLDTARQDHMDPDLLSMAPFIASVTGLFAVLGYACSAFFYALAARSVGRGNRPSFALAVFSWAAAVLACGVQPFAWNRMYTRGNANTRSILEQIAEDLPWWLTATELAALALVALSTVAVGLLLSPAAKRFRLPAPEPAPAPIAWRFDARPRTDAAERDAHRPQG